MLLKIETGVQKCSEISDQPFEYKVLGWEVKQTGGKYRVLIQRPNLPIQCIWNTVSGWVMDNPKRFRLMTGTRINRGQFQEVKAYIII